MADFFGGLSTQGNRCGQAKGWPIRWFQRPTFCPAGANCPKIDAMKIRPSGVHRVLRWCGLVISLTVLTVGLLTFHGAWTRGQLSTLSGDDILAAYLGLVYFLAIVVPTVILWTLDARYPLHRCQQCGYDLTGNTSGVCPECGHRPLRRANNTTP